MPIAAPADETPDDGDPLIGAVVGDALIIRLIGIDGLDCVYEGYWQPLGFTVAVRVMRPVNHGTEGLGRFDPNKNLVIRFLHPGVVQVFAAGVHVLSGMPVPYSIMELVPDARTLPRYAEEFRLTVRARVDLFRSVCDAVAHIHEQGVVHRDLKPANILVDAEGRPKVTGFLLATATEPQGSLTTTDPYGGRVVGTLHYMSPERMRGDLAEIDFRSDVYSLGVVLHELLTGRRPHELRGKSILERIQIVQEHEPAPITAFDRSLHRDLVAIVGKCLQRERDARYTSASALRDDLDRHLAGEPIFAAPPTFMKRVRRLLQRASGPAVQMVWFLLGLAALCLTALAGVGLVGGIARRSWPRTKFCGALTVLGLSGAFFAFRRAFQR